MAHCLYCLLVRGNDCTVLALYVNQRANFYSYQEISILRVRSGIGPYRWPGSSKSISPVWQLVSKDSFAHGSGLR